MGRMSEAWYRRKAKEGFHLDGELEIDDGATVSGSGDEGDYVQAWVWVPDPDIGIIDVPDPEILYYKIRDLIEAEDLYIPDEAGEHLGEVCRAVVEGNLELEQQA